MPLTRRPGGVQAYQVIYPPAERPPRGHRPTPGYEWFSVLDGRVRFVLGDREFELGPGDAAEFDTTLPHWIGSAANHPAELLPRTPGATHHPAAGG